MSWQSILKTEEVNSIPKHWVTPSPEHKKIVEEYLESQKRWEIRYKKLEEEKGVDDLPRKLLLEIWNSPEQVNEMKTYYVPFYELEVQLKREIIAFAQRDLPLSAWLDTEPNSPTQGKEKQFEHWYFSEFNEWGGRMGKEGLLWLLDVAGDPVNWGDAEKYLKDYGQGMDNDAKGLLYQYQEKILEYNEKLKQEKKEKEAKKKEGDWKSVLAVARQWGIKPDNPKMGMMMIWNNKDTEALKEQLSPAAIKYLEKKKEE